MPFHTHTHTRRRNPDPPQTLTQYLAAEFAAAVSEQGARVAPYPAVTDALAVDYGDTKSKVWFGLAFPHFTAGYDYANLLRSAAFLAPVAESLGEILTFSTPFPWDAAAFPEFIAKPSDLRIFLPSGVKNKRVVANAVQTYRRPSTERASSERAYAALPVIWKALAEARSRDVPRKYRKQVEELFRSAFRDDDLATYLQARELVAMVSE